MCSSKDASCSIGELLRDSTLLASSQHLRLVTQRDTAYIMIIGFRHKGLEAFFRTGTTKGVQASHVK